MSDIRAGENARASVILHNMSTTSTLRVLVAGIMACVASTAGNGPVAAVEAGAAVASVAAVRQQGPTPGDCESYRPLFELHAPEGGWDVDRMLNVAQRETGCCPRTLHRNGTWRTTQGGDRYSSDCVFSHVATWRHRSDAGLLQINGINYDPARCDPNHCLSGLMGEPVTVETLGDPEVNIRAAAALCELTRSWGWGCYSAWRRR